MPVAARSDAEQYRKLVEQIADRIWKRMQADLRQQRDRRPAPAPRRARGG